MCGCTESLCSDFRGQHETCCSNRHLEQNSPAVDKRDNTPACLGLIGDAAHDADEEQDEAKSKLWPHDQVASTDDLGKRECGGGTEQHDNVKYNGSDEKVLDVDKIEKVCRVSNNKSSADCLQSLKMY